MRHMVLSLLQPHQQRAMEDQETFKMMRDHGHKIDKQIDLLNKTVFENGEGVQILQIIMRDIESLRSSIEEVDKNTDKKFKMANDRINETN